MSNLIIPDGGNIGSSSDTDAITISSTGKVTTADSELNVKTTSHTFTVKGIDEVIYEDDGTTVVDSDSGQFAVYNGSTKLLGITEHGYVLKPYQPYARSSSASATSATAVIPLDANILNQGITVSNNKFTIPVSGSYLIGYSHLGEQNSTQVHIRQNGSAVSGTYSQQIGGNNGTFSTQTVIDCSANDYLEFWCNSGRTHGNSNYNSMWACLLG